MNPGLPLAAFEIGRPLFGHQGLALLVILGGIAVFIALVALLGRWLAATHPEPASRLAAAPSLAATDKDGVPPEVIVAIIAAVAEVLGDRATITAVAPVPVPAPSIEALMQHWSYEGRRQIYSSHKVR